jgi:broad specificity phosphatase PhoE
VANLLTQGCRVSLFVRHSERPPIDPGDETFGQALPLTPRGVELARDAGRHLLFPPAEGRIPAPQGEAPRYSLASVRFAASPMVRCQMTARGIAEGMGLPDAPVADEPVLGVGCFYYEDPVRLQAVMRERGYLPFMLEYLRKGTAPYSRPLDVATPLMTEWLKGATTRPLNVLVSHDIFVASLLTDLKVRTYTADNWVGFIHGAAIINTPDGDWLCHPCAPEIAAGDAAFVH